MEPILYIERTPPEVPSSNIDDLGYDAEHKTLAVGFKNGSIFHFSGVPLALYEAFRKAPSAGKFFHAAVRGKFTSRKVAPLVLALCPQCGDEGIKGAVCDNCGEETYRVDRA